MANQTLAEFTEKLFVADGDHTFIWDTLGAISKRVSRNSWLSGTTADFHLGLADAASPVAQTISVQSVVAGTTNTAGANLSINGSQGTGTGAGGSLLLRTAPAGSSGTAQNALVTAVAITSAGNVGIGTTAPTAPLEIRGASVTNTRESLLKCTLSDAGNDAFHVFNGTSLDGRFSPSFSGSTFSSNLGSLVFSSQTDNANDTGTAPLMIFSGRITNSQTDPNNGAFSTVTTRSLFAWNNLATTHMQMAANGNLGIGTTSPTSKLHVVGDGLITGTLAIGDTGTSLKQFAIAGQAISNSLYLSAPQYIGFNVPIIALMNGGVRSAIWDRLAGITLTASNYYGFCSSETDAGFLPDTILRRDGETDHLAMRRSTNGQKFSVYGTYPGAAWERFTITAPTSGNVLLGTYKGTGGIARGLEFQTDGVTRMTLGTTEITTTVPFTSSGLGKFVGVQLGTSGSSRLVSPGYGIATFLDSDGTGNFTKLNLAGNTDSFPSLKRSTTRIQAVLATTDTTFTNIQGKLTTDTAFNATVVTPTGFITLYDSTGTAYKVPCVPA